MGSRLVGLGYDRGIEPPKSEHSPPGGKMHVIEVALVLSLRHFIQRYALGLRPPLPQAIEPFGGEGVLALRPCVIPESRVSHVFRRPRVAHGVLENRLAMRGYRDFELQ